MDEKSEKEAELFKKRQKHRKIPLKYHKKCRKILEKKKNFLPRGDSNPRPLALLKAVSRARGRGFEPPRWRKLFSSKEFFNIFYDISEVFFDVFVFFESNSANFHFFAGFFTFF